MQNKGSVVIILIIALALVGIGASYYLGTQKARTPESYPIEVPDRKDNGNVTGCTMEAKICPDGTAVGRSGPNCEFAPCPGESSGTDAKDWKTYTNEGYGFLLKYPPKYQALTDSENLYGWKNGVVLFYDGGQSYDLAIQVWNSSDEYKEEYKDTSNITEYEVNGKIFTLLNANNNPEVDEMISTFQMTEE